MVEPSPEQTQHGDSEPRAWQRAWVGALLLVVAGALAWQNSFDGAYLFDDHTNLVNNPNLRSLSPLSSALGAPAQSGLAGRPLASLTFALTWALGDGEVWAHHLGNLIVHLLAALAAYGLLRRLFALESVAAALPLSPAGAALAVALLWTVHPLQTGSITYLGQRIEALMGLFFLLTLYAALRSCTSERSAGWSLLAVLACWAGVTTKEVTVAAPLLALLFDVRFQAGSVGAALKRRPGLYAGLASSLLLLGVMVLMADGRSDSVGFSEGPGAWGYLKMQAAALVLYLRLSLWPHPLIFDYGTDPMPAAATWIASGAVVLALLAATLVLLTRRGVAARLAGFAGAWFFLILAPTSSFLPIHTEPIVEHRMYLPLLAVLGLVVVSGGALLRRALSAPGARRSLALGLVAVIAVGEVLATRARNEVYGTELGMWADVVAKLPDNARAHTSYANDLRVAGRLPESLHHYEEAVRLAPGNAWFHANLGSAFVDRGRLPEGIAMYRRAIELEPGYGTAHANLAHALASTRDLEGAEQAYRSALRLDAENESVVRREFARLLEGQGRRAEAVEQLRTAVQLAPNDTTLVRRLAWLWVRAPEPELRSGADAVRAAQWLAGQPEPSAHDAVDNLDLLAAGYAEQGLFELAARTAREGEALAGRLGARSQQAQLGSRAGRYEGRRSLADR